MITTSEKVIQKSITHPLRSVHHTSFLWALCQELVRSTIHRFVAASGAGLPFWEISGKGKPAPYWATNRWVVERTSSWHNAHKKLVWCTERVGRVVDFWVAFSDVVIIVRRLIREGWTRYRWEGRPSRRP